VYRTNPSGSSSDHFTFLPAIACHAAERVCHLLIQVGFLPLRVCPAAAAGGAAWAHNIFTLLTGNMQ